MALITSCLMVLQWELGTKFNPDAIYCNDEYNGHAATILCMAYAAEHKLLATGAEDGPSPPHATAARHRARRRTAAVLRCLRRWQGPSGSGSTQRARPGWTSTRRCGTSWRTATSTG